MYCHIHRCQIHHCHCGSNNNSTGQGGAFDETKFVELTQEFKDELKKYTVLLKDEIINHSAGIDYDRLNDKISDLELRDLKIVGDLNDRINTTVELSDLKHEQQDAEIQEVQNIVKTLPFKDGYLSDSLIIKSANGEGQIVRTQKDKNNDYVTVYDYGAIGDGAAHKVKDLYTPNSAIYNSKYTSFEDTQKDYPLAKTEEDYIDRIAFQQAINDRRGKSLHVPAGHYVFDAGLVIDYAIRIVGDLYPLYPHSYSNASYKLDFSMVNDEPSIWIAKNEKVSGTQISGLFLKGSRGSNTAAIQTGNRLDSVTNDCTNMTVTDVTCYEYHEALRMTYTYGVGFYGFRAQSCNYGIVGSNQCNAIHFNRLGLVTIYFEAIKLTNCEGISFETGNISNLMSTSEIPIKLFQSTASFNNSYFEYNKNSNNKLFLVGSSGESPNVSSKLSVNNSYKISGDIVVASPHNYVEVTGTYRTLGTGEAEEFPRIVATQPNIPVKGFLNGLNSFRTRKVIREYKAFSGFKNFQHSFSPALAYDYGPNYIKVTNSAGIATGITLAVGLEVGKLYTLSLCISAFEGARVNIKSGNDAPLGLSLDSVSLTNSAYSIENPSIMHIPFINSMDAGRLHLLFTGSLAIHGYRVIEGNVSSEDDSFFNDILVGPSHRLRHLPNLPVDNTHWKSGDRIIHIDAAEGEPMWWNRYSTQWLEGPKIPMADDTTSNATIIE